MKRVRIILGLLLLSATAGESAELPSLNVQATCKATPSFSMSEQKSYDNCMRSENAARDRLGKTWDNMRAEWRSTCLNTTTLGGIPNYVELLTCVEMREAAANPGAETKGTGSLERKGGTRAPGGVHTGSADPAGGARLGLEPGGIDDPAEANAGSNGASGPSENSNSPGPGRYGRLKRFLSN